MQFARNKEDILKKAAELADEYIDRYKGCGECTFLAIVDALRWGGVDILPEEMSDRIFPGLCQLSGGVGISSDGSCGAVTGGALAIGIALGVAYGAGDRDQSTLVRGCEAVQEVLLDRFDEKYRSQLCKDVQRKRFGKSWDFKIPEMAGEFLEITDGCAIKETALWTTEFIVDELERA